MKILSIEPTPSPNSMKVVIDQDLPFGKSFNYTKENIQEASTELQAIFAVEGVKGIYHVSNFLAVERNAKFAWETDFSRYSLGFGGEQTEAVNKQQLNEHYGEVNVHVQMYKAIPLQIKAFDGEAKCVLVQGDAFYDCL